VEASPQDVRFNDISARRSLQAYLTRLSKSADTASEWAIPMLAALTILRGQEQDSSSGYSTFPPSQPFNHVDESLNGNFDDPTTSRLCDTVVFFFSPWKVVSAIRGGELKDGRKSAEFWTLMFHCLAQSLPELEDAMTDFAREHQDVPAAAVTFEIIVLLAKQGNELLLKHFIERAKSVLEPTNVNEAANGLENNRPRFRLDDYIESALEKATEGGKIRILDLLLPLITTRINLSKDMLRGRLLYRACELGLSAIVDLILRSGLSSAYNMHSQQPNNMFSMAIEHNHIDCLYILLENQQALTMFTSRRRARLFEWGLWSTIKSNSLDAWIGWLPDVSEHTAAWIGAAIDGGLEAAEFIKGPFDFNRPVGLDKNQTNWTSGSFALFQAVEYGRLSNVKALLAAQVGLPYYDTGPYFDERTLKERPAACEEIYILLVDAHEERKKHRGVLVERNNGRTITEGDELCNMNHFQRREQHWYALLKQMSKERETQRDPEKRLEHDQKMGLLRQRARILQQRRRDGIA
jgi:hypothetical protein